VKGLHMVVKGRKRCKRATQKRKGPMQVKGPTEVNFKQGGGKKNFRELPFSPTFKMMAPLLNVVH